MKLKLLQLVLCFVLFNYSETVFAQERVDHKQMTYLFNPKPNSILYNDTLYKGSNQFAQLFYRTHDDVLINLYTKHQSNKIWGTAIGLVGTIATTVGVIMATGGNNSSNNTAGWITAGSGLACSIFGTYLIQSGQKNLALAVTLFNQKYNKSTVGIGISGHNAGLVLNF